MEEEIIKLTKEQAWEIAKFNNDNIHCFLSASFGLIGADHSKKSFTEELNSSSLIEVGGENCRRMGHALVLWIKGTPYFFEHDEEKLLELENNIDR